MPDRSDHRPPLAIAAASCRLPGGVQCLTDLGDVLMKGDSLVSDVPANRWAADFHDPTGATPGTTRTHRGSFLEEVDRFDAAFFGVGEPEAQAMDPQHRVLLEVAWEAMRQVEPMPSAWSRSRTGVFVGLLSSDYRSLHLTQGGLAGIGAHYAPGNEASFAAGRVAFHFDLAGPAVGVSTACSSSLVALTAAADALRLGHIDRALVAGVNLLLCPELSIYMSRIGALSPSGSCQPFRAQADGVVRGDGCAAIILTRTEDCPSPLALVRGYGTNHNGLSAGLTAPCSSAQRELLSQVWESCGLDGAGIDFVETHGTGTPLGDPVEASALADTVGSSRDGRGPLPIGSHKANFGHLDAAAGLVGLLKAVLVTRTGLIPPQPPGGDPAPLPPTLDLVTELTAITPDRPIRAAVSAFGLSGTNAHVVLEAPPETPTNAPEGLLLAGGASHEEVEATLAEFDHAAGKASAEEAAWLARASAAEAQGSHRAAYAFEPQGGRTLVCKGTPDTRRPLVLTATALGSSPGDEALEHARRHPKWQSCVAACAEAVGVDLEEMATERPRSPHADALLTAAVAAVRLATLIEQGLRPAAVVGEGWLTGLDNRREEPLRVLFRAALKESEVDPGVTALVTASAAWVASHLTVASLLSDRGAECAVALADLSDLHEVAEACRTAGVDLCLVDLAHQHHPFSDESFGARLARVLAEHQNAYVLDLSARSHAAIRQHDWALEAAARAWVAGVDVRRTPENIGRRPSAGGETLPAMRWKHNSFWSPQLRVPSRRETMPDPSPEADSPPVENTSGNLASRVSGCIDAALTAALQVGINDLPSPEDSLIEAGLTSLDCVALADVLARDLGIEIPTTTVLEHPTRAELADVLVGMASASQAARTGASEEVPQHDQVKRNDKVEHPVAGGDEIAIVGHAFRLPGATDDDELWELLSAGEPTAAAIPQTRPGSAQWSATDDRTPRVASYLDAIDEFDHRLFSMSPAEARWVDPQHRLLLEVSWDALSRAGLSLATTEKRRRTGVFIGLDSSDYGQLATGQPDPGFEYYGTGNSPAAASGRISHAFDLGGPTLTLDTACSSSLTAVHEARKALLNRDCDQVVVGAANLIITPTISRSMTRAGALAPDGRCKTFSAAANGYGRGDGVVVVVLKRLSDALRDGDRVEAVLEGSALSHDGRGAGFTVPSVEAQASVISRALAVSGRSPSQVAAVEAHGTGTALGDPMELRGLAQVFNDTPVAVGTAKTVFGHLEAAAGLLGVLKAVLCLQHGEFPRHPLQSGPTHDFDWTAHHIVPSAGLPLGPDDAVGVSAFGFTGTNAHAVLRASPGPAQKCPAPRQWVLPVSGHTAAACRARLLDLATAAAAWDADQLAGAIALLSRSPRHLRHRLCPAGDNADELLTTLRQIRERGSLPEIVVAEPSSLQADIDSPTGCADQEFLQGRTPLWVAGQTSSAPALPTYPFERAPHWFPEQAQAAYQPRPTEPDLLDQPVRPTRSGRPTRDYTASIAQVFSEVLEMETHDIDPDLGLFDLGVDSIQAVAVCERLSDLHKVEIDPTATFEHSTVRRLAAHIADLVGLAADPNCPTSQNQPSPATVTGPSAQALETAVSRARALLNKGAPS